MHLIACFWASSSKIEVGSYTNWTKVIDIDDDPSSIIYITSLYWVVVTTMTIGYGDITPTDTYETLLCLLCFIVGAACFSYALSSISNNIMELTIS